MCGIAGFWSLDGQLGREECSATVRRMTRSLVHRGPDDEGYFEQPDAGVYLGHRRLAIVDLSKEGHQPMQSPSGRYVTVYNGEIFNHRRLRPELEQCGFTFRGHSDTEVLLAAIEHWGLRGAIERAIGMFSLALWDRRDRTLTLVRDRLGIKPLYYGWVGGRLVFGSELKALRLAMGFSNRIHRGALTLFLRHNYIPEPWSIYEGIYKLMPGTWVSFDSTAARRQYTPDELVPRTTVYWSAKDVVERGSACATGMSVGEATEQLEALLRDAVGLRMEADVPLGAFLSGGVDSSTVVALMQAQSSRPVKTFTIGFHEAAFDEAPHARAVAEHLGTDHTEMFVTAREAMDVIPTLAGMYDEPFSDSSQIPTYLVSKIARCHVTVSLSGDGGDELFGGYTRYFLAERMWNQLRRLPSPARRAIAQSLLAAPGMWSVLLKAVGCMFPRRWPVNNSRDKVTRLADFLRATSPSQLYELLVSHWSDPAKLVRDAIEPLTALTDPGRQAGLRQNTERMMYTDLISYLPGDILTKVDRASMAVALEARVPLLDHRVVEFAWQLPLDLKIRHTEGKWILREILYKYVPRKLIDRPKQGFGIPIGDWLRGPLREWAEGLLDERRLRTQGYLNPAPIRALWLNHLRGRVDEAYRLWDVLMFQAWLEHDLSRGSEQAPKEVPENDALAPSQIRVGTAAAVVR
jgi:asparagine synthase (glutamine-hydrolysing)